MTRCLLTGTTVAHTFMEDPFAPDALVGTLSGHTSIVYAFEQPVLRPGVLISSSIDETCKVWNLETQNATERFQLPRL